ncbi:MAG: nicotinate (nicotinamide) nucleotide adenylyltransferase [Bacteroides sp.]|nr:nicotinate (nicotinamide) nucleotide adenylyltransferase [Roseburia sp.]MCM1346214.1 nicotinate (nicotinamide) nucleotide adenylyltransferase [Bacteroides sp.]MCM1420691.1 nicotinate (nicotinamide) nucleotide adenylyltransferase [Bacteroides sp.]
MNIGIYGGSFNPIHVGHTSLAKSLCSQGLVNEVWFLVSPLNPLKQDQKADILNYEDRLALARIAVETEMHLRVSDFEAHLPVPSYTYTTLQRLSAAYPEHNFSLIIGADNWLHFNRWYKADEILKEYAIIVYQRPGYEISSVSPGVTVADTPLYDVSSTQIREMIKKGECPSADMLSPKVFEYIESRKLYSALSKAD